MMKVWESEHKHAWITDYLPAGIELLGAMSEIKEFAYRAFDHLDNDGDGFLDRLELENALDTIGPEARERAFVLFMLCHLKEIAASYSEDCITRSDGISRADLDAYFLRFH